MWNKLNQFALSLITRVQLMKEDGQALVEYSLILALVSVVAIVALVLVGTQVTDVFNKIGTELEKALAKA
jgi:pilus assembly protein Flp/PilA